MPHTVAPVARPREPSSVDPRRAGCSRLRRVAIWLQLSAGHGPPECTWVLPRLVDALLAAAAEAGVAAACLERVPGSEAATLRSALIELSEGPCEAFAADWQGSALWVGRSPFRPEHRRRNWFVQVSRIEPPDDDEVASLRAADLEVTAMRSTGAGGQNVNKRSTAVRVRHLPSGLEVVARGERSQSANRREGLARLAWLLREQAQGRRELGQRAMWDAKGQVERGRPRQVFRGPEFVRDAST